MPKKINAEIMYIGFEFDDHDFINSQELNSYLGQHPYLKVVEEAYDEDNDEEFFKLITLPVTKNEGPIIIIDERLEEPGKDYLLICHEDDAYIDNPSEEFVTILKMMQTAKALNEEELFIDQSNYNQELEYSPSHWSWEFDFAKGKYIIPETLKANFDFTTGRYDI